ncbi:unnamed protein product [Phytophthora fragariaefolia]|uniref:Unnamed protein product n=1 Tax=Phytophthora fragariaefolia TaxID=1490495 RepID=A0A9W6X5Z7_9STRA|nr:unnamed protein product [Phytophthora fragariaefolia]
MIKFVLMVNKQGQTRLAQYYEFLSIQERVALEAEIIRKCLGRNETQVPSTAGQAFPPVENINRLMLLCSCAPVLQCSFVEYRGYKVIYRRYASLFFIVGVKDDDSEVLEEDLLGVFCGGGTYRVAESLGQNELGILEFIHALVETMDKYFESVVRWRGPWKGVGVCGVLKSDAAVVIFFPTVMIFAAVGVQCELDVSDFWGSGFGGYMLSGFVDGADHV